MPNNELLKYFKITEKEYERMTPDKKRQKIQQYVSERNKAKRLEAQRMIKEAREDARFRFNNPDKVKQRKALEKAGFLKKK